jgi:hypothetical protein
MKKLMALCAALAVTGLTLVAAAPASAHSGHWITTDHGFGSAIYRSDGSTTVCNDTTVQGYAVVHFRNQPFGPVHHTTGVSWGCLTERHPDLYDYRVCHIYDACSGWHLGRL